MALAVFDIYLFVLKGNFSSRERDSTSCLGLPPGGRGGHRQGQRAGRDGPRGPTGSSSRTSIHIWNLSYNSSLLLSDYGCKEEFEHEVIFPAIFIMLK